MTVISTLLLEIKDCRKCLLSEQRTNSVPGYGNFKADVLFIGEGPGKNEDLQAKPFVGAAGKLLDKLLDSIDMTRDDIYITNVVKCRPPNNRDPLKDEVKTCWSYLERQIKIIKPKLIVTLGRHSMNRFMKNLKISDVHGKSVYSDGIWQNKQMYLPLYHPAAALYDPRKKNILFQDFAQIPIILKTLK